MKRIKNTLMNIVLSYVLSGIVTVLIVKYPNYQGHADVPFSGGLLGILLLAPFAPIMSVANFNVVGIVVFCLAFVCFYFVFTWLIKKYWIQLRSATTE